MKLGHPAYLIAHACFSCRKSFKMSPRAEFQARCPNCGGLAMEMGRSFKAPPQSDVQQWEKVRRLYVAGFRFRSYRSNDDPPYPDTLAEVDAFIAANPNHRSRQRDV